MKGLQRYRGLWLLVGLWGLTAVACQLGTLGQSDNTDTVNIPRDAAVVTVVANSSLVPWLQQAANDFNATESQTADGKTAFAMVQGQESGQFITDIAGGSAELPTLWLPDSPVWTNVLADQGYDAFQTGCVSVARSPLVIGVWRPAAESLGWPSYALGWLDFGSLAQDPAAWKFYSGGAYGDNLRLSHTHPGLSGAGASTLLALVQSAQRQTEAVTVDEISLPLVQASVGAFESAVAYFASDPYTLAQTMSERGAAYLGAAVMYESDAVSSAPGQIVPIYPLEGTFVATHPACINRQAAAVEQEAASLFRDYLLSDAGQATAVTHALRPVNGTTPVGAPLTAENGVDLDQPAIVFGEPTVASIYAIQDVWQAARKPVNLVLLLDTSGSMRGSKMESMREAAVQFVAQMGDDDHLTIIAFSTEPYLLVEGMQVGEARVKLTNTIRDLNASGDTTLFDAIGDGATSIARTNDPALTNAMVVLSDGQDTRSYRYRFNQDLIDYATGSDTTIFTIAYGSDADEGVLGQLAISGNGNFYRGDEASIAAIYEAMSAAFGGSVGVGR
ncbi:MAG: VWA domain-containing protein [Chloroflexi bacterium]|nr:VWA domain-containing protein [Chloroflexota bacterium]